MTDEATDLVPPKLTADDVLRVPDDRFTTDTVAIVTGAGSGIGRATAVALASNELTVAGLDIDEEGLDETVDVAASVDAAGRVVPIRCDLTADDAVEAAVEEAADLGRSGTPRTSPGCNTSRRSSTSRWIATTSCTISCFGRRSSSRST